MVLPATTKCFLGTVDKGQRSSTVVSLSHVKVHSHQRKESTCNLDDRNHSRSTSWLLRRTSCLQGANPEWAVPDQLCHVEIAKRPGKDFVACSKEGISTFSPVPLCRERLASFLNNYDLLELSLSERHLANSQEKKKRHPQIFSAIKPSQIFSIKSPICRVKRETPLQNSHWLRRR